MKLNTIERAAMNNPIRAAHQHHREAAWFRRLAGGDLTGQDVLETGCGRGVGSEVILDRLQARHVTAFDLDDTMVELARKRLHHRPVSLSVGDVCDIHQPTASHDTVVDFGLEEREVDVLGECSAASPSSPRALHSSQCCKMQLTEQHNPAHQ